MNGDGQLWDLIAIGGGGCGIAATLGFGPGQVLLLEKTGALGGNTELSTGSIPAALSRLQKAAGIDDSAESMADDIWRQAGEQGDRAHCDRLSDVSAALIDWLMDDLDVELILASDYLHVGHSKPRLHTPPSREGVDLIADLSRAVERAGISVQLETPVQSVERSADGFVVSAWNGQQFRTRNVILAGNGFAGNPNMVKQYIPEIAGATYYGAPGNTGDTIKIGVELGGTLAAMGSYQSYAAVEPDSGILASWTLVEKGAIIVDKWGKRLGDEMLGYSAFGRCVKAADGGTAFVIYDDHIRQFVAGNEQRFRRLLETGAATSSTDIAQLAAQLGIPLPALRHTIRTYNAAATAAAGDDEFGRSEFGLAPLTGQLSAIKVEAGLYHTQGGLTIDLDARVVRGDASPIDGLYAGGGTAIGLSGVDGAAGYSSGNGLLAAIGWGWIAGRHSGGNPVPVRTRT